MEPMNILCVGLGPLGRLITADFLARGLGRVVGAVDIDPQLAGKRLDEVLGTSDPRGSAVVRGTIEQAIADAGGPGKITAAIVATSSDLAKCAPTLRELLARGVSVVSTCEELLWPWLRHEAIAHELEALCAKSGAKVVGTGVNPGFLMDTLPVFLSAVCKTVRAVHVERFQDARPRRVPFQQKIGAALSEAEFAKRVEAGTLRHVGLGESMHFVSHALGLGVARWHESLEPVRTKVALESAVGTIKAGGISGVRQVATGWNARGAVVVTLEFQAAIGQENPRDRVKIDADPSLEMVIPGAVHSDVATSAITLNTVPRLVEAKPGLHTMATLALPRFIRGA